MPSSPETLPLPEELAASGWTAEREVRMRLLVEQNYRFLWRSMRRLGVREADADDCLQRVFWVTARRLDQLQLGKERSFLFGTTVRVAADYRRALRRRKECSASAAPEHSDVRPGPEDVTTRKHALALLDRVLDELPTDLRTVFVLHEIEEMQRRDIAQLLDLPPGTVASRLRRARQHFESAAAQIRAESSIRRSHE